MKAFRREAWLAVADDVTTMNFCFDVDFLYHLRCRKKSIMEIPTRCLDDCKDSTVRPWREVPRMLLSIIRLRLWSLLHVCVKPRAYTGTTSDQAEFLQP
jgi:hypothetical protein